MFINNLLYELKILKRSNWLIVLIVSIVMLLSFGGYNGNKNITKRHNDTRELQGQLHKKDSILLATLTQIENGEELDMPHWQLPSDPMTVGYRNPRLAIMPPEALSFIATGQSDMYTHSKSPTVYGNNFALDYSEMVNPVQLLFGNFDVAFIIIYILPLLIIAFTFNVLSKEKELGTLRLLGAQPISIVQWFIQKMCIRYLIFTLITTATLLVVIFIFSNQAMSNVGSLLGLLFILAGYHLFWFAVSFIINIKINNSSKNAFSLIGLWLLVVMILPATINQIGNSLYPTPSRLKLINEIRQIKKENEEKQEEILKDYLRNHPELAQESDEDKFGFWERYFASEKFLEEKTKPILSEYDLQLEKQQKLINTFKYVSPAILMQQSLNSIAGTSEKHYNDYKKQVVEFSDRWRNYLIPMLFKGQKFTLKEYHEMPKFIYKNRIGNHLWSNVAIIISISVLLGIAMTRKRIKPQTLQTFST